MRLTDKLFGLTLAVLCLMPFCVKAETLFPKIFVETLPEVNLSTVGIETIVPNDIWGDSAVSDIEVLIKDIVLKPMTPVMRERLTEIMMAKTFPALSLEFRLATLMHMGQWEKVLQLIDLVPPVYRTDKINAVQFQALFFSGKTQQACHNIDKNELSAETVKKWRLACALTKKDKAGATLIYATHKEGNEWDKTTAALAGQLFDDKTAKITGDMIRPHHLPLMAALGDKIQWDTLDLSFALQRIAASMDGVPWSYRIKAAERTMPVALLDTFYLSVPSDVKDRSSVLKRALLYQKMVHNVQPAELEKLIKSYWECAASDGMFLTLAPMTYPMLQRVKPSEENVSLAFGAVQVYALAHQVDFAYAWFQVLKNSFDDTHRKQVVSLTPLMQWLGAGISKESIFEYCRKKRDEACAQLFRRAEFDLKIADAEVVFYPWGNQSSYSLSAGQMIRYLIQNNRTGEALLRAIKALQDSPYFEWDIIQALRHMAPKSLFDSLITERYISYETSE